MLNPPRMIAGVLGLGAFVTACTAGLASGAEASDTLWRALTALIVCSIVGALLGRIGMVAIDEHVATHIEANPIPEEPARTDPGAIVEPPDVDGALERAAQSAPPAQAA